MSRKEDKICGKNQLTCDAVSDGNDRMSRKEDKICGKNQLTCDAVSDGNDRMSRKDDGQKRRIQLPLTRELARSLTCGETVYLTGTIYTSRDAGHKRMTEALSRGEALPFDPTDATIYYVGPTPARPGQVIGSAGPTTSGRMDAYAPAMMRAGARGMIGKGARLPEVVEAMKECDGVYFGAIGGAGALLAKCIKSSRLIAYEDLGAEALRELWVEDFPVVVMIDCTGRNLYEEGRKAYLDKRD